MVCACDNSPKRSKEGLVYQVDLNKKMNPFEDIFSKAEIIPLLARFQSSLLDISLIFCE